MRQQALDICRASGRPDDMADTNAGPPPDGPLAPVRARRDALEAAATELERSLAAPSATTAWRDGVISALERTQGVLEQHLRASAGEAGVPESIVQADPRLIGPAERLAREHDELVSHQRAVTALAHDASSAPEAVRDAAAELAALLLRHVQHAHDLLYDAFESELGGGD
jgi:hypothetical protein